MCNPTLLAGSSLDVRAIRTPSLFGLGLEIGGAAVNAYDLYDRRNRDR